MNRTVRAAIACAIVLVQPRVASAAEIKVWTARALATVLAEVGAEFERTTGHRLTVVSDLPAGFLRRVNAGESFDLLITVAAPLDEWIRDGRVIAQTRTDISRSGIGVQVRAGRPKPDVSTVDAFKAALLNARSIAYLRIGSGLYLDGLLERLGIAQQVKPKAVRPETDIVSELVAKGEVELGVTVITQILTTPGVELAGPLPREVQSYLTFAAGVGATSQSPEAAKQLIGFLRGDRAKAVMKSQGMEPAGVEERSAQVDKTVRAFLDSRRGTWRDLNVPESDGRVLHDLVVKHSFTRALEIGTSTGHSGIWIAWALAKTGGKLTTVEIDPARHRTAVANFKEAGLAPYIDARLGDAHEIVPKLQGPYDFVFSDADKEWYKNYFVAVWPKVARGGCFTAHNVSGGSVGQGIRDFLAHLKTLPDAQTTFDSNSRAGISISCKR